MVVLVSLKNVCKLPISDISGRVMARVPNGMIGECRKLLLSDKFGLLSMGTRANGPLSIGGEVPERRNGELFGYCLWAATGETDQMFGGGGVSHRLLDVERRLPPPGGVPITNCTDGGERELMSMSFCTGLFSERFMLIGCERGIVLFDD